MYIGTATAHLIYIKSQLSVSVFPQSLTTCVENYKSAQVNK